MADAIDLNTLTHDQLVFFVQVRGQALAMHHQADELLMEKLENGGLQEDELEKYIAAKNDILRGLMNAEEQILAGRQNSLPN